MQILGDTEIGCNVLGDSEVERNPHSDLWEPHAKYWLVCYLKLTLINPPCYQSKLVPRSALRVGSRYCIAGPINDPPADLKTVTLYRGRSQTRRGALKTHRI